MYRQFDHSAEVDHGEVFYVDDFCRLGDIPMQSSGVGRECTIHGWNAGPPKLQGIAL